MASIARRRISVPPDRPGPFPGKLVMIVVIVVAVVIALLADEAYQVDPIIEHHALAAKRTALVNKMEQLSQRRRDAWRRHDFVKDNPDRLNDRGRETFIPRPTYESVEHHQREIGKEVKAIDKEVGQILDQVAVIEKDMAALPPPGAKRESLVRRLLKKIYTSEKGDSE